MNTETKPTKAAEISQEQIDAWKKEHEKGVWEINVGKEEEAKKGYLRKPNREDMKYAMLQMQNGGPMAMLEVVLQECWLGGDQVILDDDDYFMGAMMQLEELMNVKFAELKKL